MQPRRSTRQPAVGGLAALTLLAASVGSLAGPGQPLASLVLLAVKPEPLSCQLSTQQLVDLLKQHTFIGQARRVVLDRLEHRYRRKFADHWEFVHWAQANLSDLDLRSPPRRPEALLSPPSPEPLLQRREPPGAAMP